MSILINRRRFMQATSTAIAVGALASAAGRATAASTGELKVNMSGGNWGDAVMKAYVESFEAETGVKVTRVNADFSSTQIAMMVDTKNVSADVVNLGQTNVDPLTAKGYLEKIDYSIWKKEDLEAIAENWRQPNGFASYVYSVNMVWNTKKFPAGKPRPTTWAEFWDVKKFPGVRSINTGEYGSGPWEEALLADGVPMDKLYPMDIDRVFASLDKIKPHIRKWWTSGSEILQIMRDNIADIVQSYDARALTLIDEGGPIEINRNQAKLTTDYWCIPKGSPNAENAQKFIALTSRPDRQAEFAKLIAQGPTNKNAFKLIPDDVARKLASHPDYEAISFAMNAKWYAEVGSDGKSNKERLVQRWNEWILQ
ncbi:MULTISPECIES: ABC transporter substrate-binding protein [Rhizobium]|uniref:ABC transporter substrate-binding protein n=4 Tax=Rhizobium TaxID=379 RepID=A0A6P1CD58_RHITR|nr:MULTISPECIES: ABC transporter substrate-binding protein [Rhizobium]AGB73623.1 putative polyamine/opine/phosphonate ABC transporter, periplasmic binding protein [Rhizobium tropici CIAT 899]AYG70536.1 ABC transporter substrate-binding protein [Rhizobium sp. CCGE531]ENN83902.1 putative polyamine/opine/phosphonate ABC transporter periplasmic binding protein [Rhizobium freirei PRF 81]MBB6489339.1 putative spermidine/putrescine transport system substrate-binding protein [Rhizobium lusitanum]NEV14